MLFLEIIFFSENIEYLISILVLEIRGKVFLEL